MYFLSVETDRLGSPGALRGQREIHLERQEGI